MSREDTNFDFKADFNPSNEKSWLIMIKTLIAMANSGGGTIRYGATETKIIGLDSKVAAGLDGAIISDKINRYINPARASVNHDRREISPSKYIVDVKIEPFEKYPFIIANDGVYKERSGTKHEFRRGEFYVRHGARNELITYADIVKIIEDINDRYTYELMKKLKFAMSVGSGFEPIYKTPIGDIVTTPEPLLDNYIARRNAGLNALLNTNELLWCFIQRGNFEHSPKRLEILLRSALRRPPTLFFWLTEMNNTKQIEEILSTTLNDTDRDKSDASRAILEVAALIATEPCIALLQKGLRESKYKHFRSAAEQWKDRETSMSQFECRISELMIEGRKAIDLSTDELFGIATSFAEKSISTNDRSSMLSRKISDIGRIIFHKKRR